MPVYTEQVRFPQIDLLPDSIFLSVCFLIDLGENGEIVFQGLTFKSPSAFSVHVKRIFNPTRKADDGWTSVKYGGQLLSSFKQELHRIQGIENKPRKTHPGQTVALA